MKRSLLVVLALFCFTLSNAQVIFNEFYVQPQTGNQEYFELYNTSTTETVSLDCYSMVVLYSGKEGGTLYKGFYVLDFPKVEIAPLGYLVGAAANPFKFQKSKNAPVQTTAAAFSWNSLGESGSLKSFRAKPDNSGYTEYPVAVGSFNDLLFGNGQSASDVKYAIFLFNNGVYVNGFMAGYGSSTVPTDITSMPPLNLTTACDGGGTKTINWQTDVKSGEFVIEVSGSDNGFIRKYDGKCGEWDKSSNPYGSNVYEHTPNETNGSASGVDEANALSITTERTVCGTRIDYSITGIIRTNRYNTEAVFPLVVQLYKDNNKNGILEAGDSLLTSRTIYEASEEFYSFTQYPSPTDPTYFLPLNPQDNYIVVFRTALGCIDKIVSPPPASIETTQTVYCGSQIDFSINRALYDATGPDGKIDFTAQIYVDTNNSGKYEAGTDQPIPGMSFPISQFNDTVTQVLPAGYTGKNYIVVYTSSSSGCTIEAAFKANPSNASLSAVLAHTCGDPTGGDVALFDVTGLSGAVESREFPLQVDLYYENTQEVNNIGIFDSKDTYIKSFTINSIAEEGMQFRPAYGQPIILVYKSKRGCVLRTDFSEAACSPLPVSLRSFTAVRNKQQVSLQWETASEQGNRGFNVQRNTKGVWENIAFVFSAAEGGASNHPLTYSYIDVNNEGGVSQYRIQQLDMDGKVGYSAIRSIKGVGQVARTIVYPNPSTNGKVAVVFEDGSAKSVIVSDVNGRVVRRYRNVENNLQIEGLESGLYSIQVTDLSSAASTTEKVIITK